MQRPRLRKLSSRAAAGVVVGVVLAVVASGVAFGRRDATPAEPIPLRGEGLALEWALDEDGVARPELVVVPTGTTPAFLPGTHVIDPGPQAPEAVREGAAASARVQHAWLMAGEVPDGAGAFGDLATDAMLDLHLATRDADGDPRPPVAAPTGKWAYVWPRDASFVAVALARTGHVDDAVDVLSFLQDVQGDDGSFEARYTVTGEVPDDRGIQTDAAGWVLWALAEVATAADEPEAVLDPLAHLLERTAAWAFALTGTPDRLPEPGMDYWEQRTRELTLGTAAPILAGLESLVTLRELAGDGQEARTAAARAEEVRLAVERAFGPVGWSRGVSGGAHDAALTFAMPPFQPEALPGAAEAWTAAIPGMLRSAGGIAPGEDWHEPDYSWTPETALAALAAAASGDVGQANEWLVWLDRHRSATGSIPEKVAPDGSPAQVAPLVWSSAVVVITLDELR